MPIPLAGIFSGMLARLLGSALGKLAIGAGTIVASAIGWFGGQIVVNEVITSPFLAQLQAQFAGAPAAFLQTIAYVEGDRAMAMIIAAYTTKIAGKMIVRAIPFIHGANGAQG